MPKQTTPKRSNTRGYCRPIKYKKPSDFKKGEVIAYYKIGKSQRDIEKLVQTPRSTVKNIIKAFNKNGNVRRCAGSGRKKKTTKRQDKAMVKMSRCNPFMSATEISESS
jgi:transposase